MARNMRRAMALRPVNSFKRIIDTSGSLAAGSVSVTTLAGTGARTDADPTNSTEEYVFCTELTDFR